MRRREFIGGLGGAAAWPVVALAQNAEASKIYRIGYLGSGSPATSGHYAASFRDALGNLGYVEGRNTVTSYHWVAGDFDRLPALVDQLLREKPDVGNGGDPIASGLVENLNHPGDNITGVNALAPALISKWLELLHEAVPQARAIATLVNPKARNAEPNIEATKTAAAALGEQLLVLNASTDQEIETAFAELSRRRIGALLVGTDIFLNSRSDAIAALAGKYSVPTIYGFRSFAVAGGLMSYGTNETEAGRVAGLYTGRILKGEKPGDLPVQQSTKVEFVINLRTAKALSLELPPSLLARADEVIE